MVLKNNNKIPTIKNALEYIFILYDCIFNIISQIKPVLGEANVSNQKEKIYRANWFKRKYTLLKKVLLKDHGHCGVQSAVCIKF